MTLRTWATGACWILSACGGASAIEPAPAAQPTGEPNVVAEAAPPVEVAPALANDQVVGLWCEYWIAPTTAAAATTATPAAPTRSADTQQYLFLEDGRFGWRAETTTDDAPKQRSGKWRVVGEQIVLVDAAGQVIEQLAIADCPANPEAEQLDARYRCRSLGGKAFWLTQAATEVDPSHYIH